MHQLFLDLATDTGAEDPQQLADTLVLLYDGAVTTAQMDKTPEPARTHAATPHSFSTTPCATHLEPRGTPGKGRDNTNEPTRVSRRTMS